MPYTTVTVRMWNAEGYLKDVATFDAKQLRCTESRVKDPTIEMIRLNRDSISVVIDPKDFPEAVAFQVIITEYK